jgi:DNA-binding GntR family transcriptional regulator
MTASGDLGARALPQRHALADEVYEALKASLMDHVISPGQRLSIDALARDLRVSQTPVREALARLESDGLVTKTALRGYSATPLLTRAELTDLFGLRLLLEPWAAARAAELADGDGRRRLDAERGSLAAPPEGDTYEHYRTLAAHDARFHLLVLELAGNAAVRVAFERTHCHLHVFRLHFATGAGGRTLDEHGRIAAAVVAGDPGAAEQAMREHLEASHARLREITA